jgi:cytochrome c-type biogenesis protein CcmH
VSALRRWGPWLALVVVLVVALVLAAGGGSSPSTSAAARVSRITSEIRCPTCKGLSAAESDAETAKAIRTEVANEVAAGRTDGEILAGMQDRYGTDILLRPSASGFEGLVWVLPVIAFVLALAGLVVAFRRWHASTAEDVTDADRARVARALDQGGAA